MKPAEYQECYSKTGISGHFKRYMRENLGISAE